MRAGQTVRSASGRTTSELIEQIAEHAVALGLAEDRVRGRDALRHPERRAAPAREGRLPGPGPDRLRRGVVPVVHAPPRRATRRTCCSRSASCCPDALRPRWSLLALRAQDITRAAGCADPLAVRAPTTSLIAPRAKAASWTAYRHVMLVPEQRTPLIRATDQNRVRHAWRVSDRLRAVGSAG